MWQLSGTSAEWNSKPNTRSGERRLPLSWRVNLLEPAAGLQVDADLVLLRVQVAAQGAKETLADAYVRQQDLIATYEQTADRPVRPQIYWRGIPAASENTHGGCELIVSAQTSLLDADPGFSVGSALPATEILKLNDASAPRFEPLDLSAGELRFDTIPGVFLFRLRDNRSYVEMVYPSDFAGANIAQSACQTPAWRLTSSLFPEPLEKGVIRRGRIRGLFLSRSGDEAAALSAYREFVDSPLPLTT